MVRDLLEAAAIKRAISVNTVWITKVFVRTSKGEDDQRQDREFYSAIKRPADMDGDSTCGNQQPCAPSLRGPRDVGLKGGFICDKAKAGNVLYVCSAKDVILKK